MSEITEIVVYSKDGYAVSDFMNAFRRSLEENGEYYRCQLLKKNSSDDYLTNFQFISSDTTEAALRLCKHKYSVEILIVELDKDDDYGTTWR